MKYTVVYRDNGDVLAVIPEQSDIKNIKIDTFEVPRQSYHRQHRHRQERAYGRVTFYRHGKRRRVRKAGKGYRHA